MKDDLEGFQLAIVVKEDFAIRFHLVYPLENYDLLSFAPDSTGMKCQKFNIVGKDEIDNLSLAKFIANVQNKELQYEMVDFHSQRPGHDLRYALDGTKMKKMGWEPQSAYDRLESTINWSLENERWLSI